MDTGAPGNPTLGLELGKHSGGRGARMELELEQPARSADAPGRGSE